MSAVVPATPTSSAPSPTSGPRSLQLIESNLPACLASPVLSPRSSLSGLSTPPPSARNFRSPNARRQSSISYFASDHVSFAETRSPATPGFPRRSNSMGVWGEESPSLVGRSKGDRRSLGAPTRNLDVPPSPGPSIDRGPLTLTEKHADLLQFIAQKESKCMELRSQLATHETELAQLKRKWERIVSRGMDRAYSTPSPLSASPSGNGASSSSAAQSTTVSSIIPSANAAIKEGVRFLAAGLDLSAPEPSPSSAFAPPVVPISGLATMSRATMASKKVVAKHTTTQSISSVSTSTSTTRSASSQSQRLSQSSASSLMSSLEDPLEEKDETIIAHPATISEEKPEVRADAVEVSPTRSTLRRRSKEGDKPSISSTFEHKPSVRAQPKGKAPLAISTPTSPPVTSPTLPTPVSGWIGSVGRKWDELQKADTFTKSQKRASLLISDMSQQFFAALASPTPQSGFANGASPLSTVPSSSPASLLDDEPEEKGLGAVLAPTIVSSPSPQAPTHSQQKDADDEEDWNW